MNVHFSPARGSAARPAASTPSRGLGWVLTCVFALAVAVPLTGCGGTADASAAEPPAQAAAPMAARLPAPLWSADGRALASPTHPAARSAAQWSGQRYATREQLAAEELLAAPYTIVIDADDEAAVESGLQLADTVHTYAGGKNRFGVFVRSHHPALAARLAERLTQEQGWANVFVVQ